MFPLQSCSFRRIMESSMYMVILCQTWPPWPRQPRPLQFEFFGHPNLPLYDPSESHAPRPISRKEGKKGFGRRSPRVGDG